jgi:hypothetical protein
LTHNDWAKSVNKARTAKNKVSIDLFCNQATNEGFGSEDDVEKRQKSHRRRNGGGNLKPVFMWSSRRRFVLLHGDCRDILFPWMPWINFI